jgi:hypothetical protein
MLLGSVFFSPRESYSGAGQEKTGEGGVTATESVIKVTITTGGGMHGPVKSRYQVGEEIPVSISLTNGGSERVKYCLSTSIFQNRPQLKRDGQLLPYVNNLTAGADKAEFIERCEMSASRQFYELQPKEPKVIDWLTLNSGAINWYGQLPAGHYELMLQRRLECCQGSMVESDKITFEVVP